MTKAEKYYILDYYHHVDNYNRKGYLQRTLICLTSHKNDICINFANKRFFIKYFSKTTFC